MSALLQKKQIRHLSVMLPPPGPVGLIVTKTVIDWPPGSGFINSELRIRIRVPDLGKDLKIFRNFF